MDLALNNLQWLLCSKATPNRTEPNQRTQWDSKIMPLPTTQLKTNQTNRYEHSRPEWSWGWEKRRGTSPSLYPQNCSLPTKWSLVSYSGHPFWGCLSLLHWIQSACYKTCRQGGPKWECWWSYCSCCHYLSGMALSWECLHTKPTLWHRLTV